MLDKVAKVDTKLPPNSGPQKIYLNSRVFCLVDQDDYERLAKYHYHLKQSNGCFYAQRRTYRNGHRVWIRMHREISHCPQGYEVHHINHKTLDNRKSNLANVTPEQHGILRFAH